MVSGIPGNSQRLKYHNIRSSLADGLCFYSHNQGITLKTPTEYIPGAARYPRILVYHEISRTFHLGINNVSPRDFHAHLDFLQKAQLSILPLRGFSERNPDNSIALTFDDGYDSFYDQVFPTLIERQIPATLFIITDFAGKRNSWDVTFGINRRDHLSWEQIQEIAASGISIGSHTSTHRHLTLLDAETAKLEIVDSKKMIEDQIGTEVTALALPYGSASTDIFIVARKAGYQEICGGVPGYYGPVGGILPRLPVYRGDNAKTLRRKLDWRVPEIARLKALQSCSQLTRLIQK
ncbi:polysaccharide deacetylase family protein [bacterium]|nr:polysaccharide deacetylase family protein [bacterium]MBU1652540.1 polysaccharide deacetylase family protein [bacterium]